MATDTVPTEDELRERVSRFVQRNFPQIAMHGGSHAVRDLDPEAGEVTIALGGACSGCGISPVTVQALKVRLSREIPEITTVHADTGVAGGAPEPRLDGGDAPF